MAAAIGQEVLNGVIVAADMLIARGDGSASEGSKVTAFKGQSGVFAVANASENLDATRTMVNTLKDKLANKKFSTPGAVQDEVSRVITDWYGTFGGNKPPKQRIAFGDAP